MSLRLKYIIFISILHLVLIILSLQLLKDHRVYFILAELFIMLSLMVSVSLYHAFIRPLNLIANAVRTIADEDFSAKLVKVGQREMDLLIDVYNQMIEKLREERVRQQEQHYFLEKLIEASPAGIVILDFNGRITSLNPAASRILDLSANQCEGKLLPELNNELTNEFNDFREAEWKVIKLSGKETYRVNKSHFMDRGARHYFFLIEEITQEILLSEKETYEKVVRMMSHEVNNTLGAVNSILDSCLKHENELIGDLRSEYKEVLKVAIERSESLQNFIGKIAEVVRLPNPMKERYDLIRLLKSVQVLLNTDIKQKAIAWKWETKEAKLELNMDVSQMEQVLINIFKNAIEAVPQNGVIIVIAESKPVRKLIVRDYGIGIAPEIKPHLFSPFYSTKRNGRGFGLTLIREILLNHGFKFDLSSKQEGFTDFTIVFG